MPQSDTIYIGVGGHVVAIDRATGAEHWRCKLRSSNFVTIAVEAEAIYAGVNGELFCVDKGSGAILWRNRLKGLGMSIVAFGGSLNATANLTLPTMVFNSSSGRL